MYNNWKFISRGSLPTFGGRYSSGAVAGAFCLYVNYSAAGSDAVIGGRLMFL